jgi:hypothetical protein
VQEKTSLLAETSIKLGLRPNESKTKVMKINAELKIFILVPLEMFMALHTFPRMLTMTLALLILFFTSAPVPPSIFTPR